MFRILSNKATNKSVNLPSSKSITHRILILASLNEGVTEILNPLYSEDTLITLEALRSFGAEIIKEENKIIVRKPIGNVVKNKIYLGNSGSSARFLIPLTMFLDKEIYFYGDEELHRRPFSELFEILKKLGFTIEANNNSLPAKVYPPKEITTDEIKIDRIPTSQIVSGLMMAFVKSAKGLKILTENKIPSMPYVEMTKKLMRRLNLPVSINPQEILIDPANKIDADWKFTCEKDLSAAAFWVAYALINNKEIMLENLLLPSLQGDEKIFEIAELLGGKVSLNENEVKISGEITTGLDYDCEDIPDLVPAIAVMGLFAPEKFVLRNVSRLEFKESNRINALVTNINKIGGKCEYVNPDLIIYPQKSYHGGIINTFNDHRIAMSFAIAGTQIENIMIDNPQCVSKSYPDFWKDFTEYENAE